MTNYMTTTDKTKAIRAEIKKECGYNARQVSVRAPHAGSIRVSVHVAGADLAKIEKIAGQFETIHRCDATGEILCGGNTFVEVSFSDRAEKDFHAANEALVSEIQEAAQALEPCESVTINNFRVVRDGHQFYITTNEDFPSVRSWFNPEYARTIVRGIFAVS